MAQLPGLQFGSGVALAQPSSGNLPVDPTPQEVGVIQDIKFTAGADIKSLYGQKQWPVDSAVGKRSLKGSLTFAQMSNALFNNLFFADTVAAGVVETSYQEPGAIPAPSGPYAITVAQAAHFLGDYGVTFAATGVPLTLIPSGTPTTGQYTVNLGTGVYTFAAADANKGVLISYTYTNATLNTTLTVGNHTMGYGPVVALNLVFPYEGGGIGAIMPNVRLGKLDFTTKIDDYLMIATEFEAFAGAGNNPINFYESY